MLELDVGTHWRASDHTVWDDGDQGRHPFASDRSLAAVADAKLAAGLATDLASGEAVT
jgi:hypothetical protein